MRVKTKTGGRMCVWITGIGPQLWEVEADARHRLNHSEQNLLKKKKKTLSGCVGWGLIESADIVSQTRSQFKLIERIHA